MQIALAGRAVAKTVVSAIGLLTLLIGFPVFAQSTIHVPVDRPTIQAAIDAAVNGDTVLVAPGTYNEILEFNGKAIALVSEQGARATIIDAQGRGSVITFDSGETTSTLVSGFTLRNGMGSFGSGIDALGSSPTIVDNIFIGNWGDAIWGNGSSMVLQRNLFLDHTVCGGFGLVTFVNSSSPSVKDNAFINNRCAALNFTLPTGNQPDVANNTFVDNDIGLAVGAGVQTNQHLYRNNLFFRNRIGIQVLNGSVANYPTFLNTLVFGNTTNYEGLPDPTGTNGNLSGDPKLGGVSAFDFHPDTGSAAIDAGTNAGVGGGEVDYHSGTRILNGTVDIGAGEYVGAQPVAAMSSDKPWIALGDSITLTWNASNASSCVAEGGWAGARALSGSQTLTPPAAGTLTYKLICTNANAARAAVVSLPVYPPPTINISLGQSTIGQDATTNLTWSTVTATSCTASGAWANAAPLSGALSVGNPAPGAYTYTLTCVGPGGTSTASVQLTVLARPTITFTIDHADVAIGATAKLTWSVVNATSCEASGNWSGPKALTGTQDVGPLPIGGFQYWFQCTGPGGSAYKSVTFAVHSPPTVTVTATPTSVQINAKSVITWSSTDATNCSASGAWSGTVAPAGSQEVASPVAGPASFSLTCVGPGGETTATASLQVYAPPVVTLSVSPSTLEVGQSATLTWSSTDATSCTASNAWTDTITTNGTKSLSPAAAGTYVYQIACTGAGGAATSTVSLNVTAKAAESGGKGGGGALGLEMVLGLGVILGMRQARLRRRTMTRVA
jgi:hypothetical protein